MLPARTTLSFYRYLKIDDPDALRGELMSDWVPLSVLGRIYVAHEGINAQLSVPTEHYTAFQDLVLARFPGMPFKIAREEKDDAFLKLVIKVRPKIVADGLNDGDFDVTNVGRHMSAREFNEAMHNPSTIVVDLRNHYECEVGRFTNALTPSANTFREALPEMLGALSGKEDQKILLYCTGGIRCEKASAYFRYKGFRDVNQLHGGIIDYARQVQEEGLESLYRGKNFVFDKRIAEAITSDVLAQCHQCDAAWDIHKNCRFEGCNRLFLQCPSCETEFQACCSATCREIMQRPKDERNLLQQAWELKGGPKAYWSKTRLPPDSIRTIRPLDEPPPIG
jgi:UPF0176 protein